MLTMADEMVFNPCTQPPLKAIIKSLMNDRMEGKR